MAVTESTTDVLLPRMLRIPDYQRGYAWEREQVQDFIDDLMLLRAGQHHYTGTVVFLSTGDPIVDDDSNSLGPVDVVDGQQRLTTICLTLNEIRRALAGLGEEQAAAGLRRNYLLVQRSGVHHPKLRLGDESNAVWEALLKDEKTPDVDTLSAKRLREAALLLRTHVQGVMTAATDPKVAVLELRDKVVTGLRFTRYALDSQSEVGVIFETLNDRGKPLTELEKAKNYFLFLSAKLPDGQQQALAAKINDAWAVVYRLLLEVARVTSAGEDQFLRAHWLATVDPMANKWKGTKSIKAHFPRDRYVDDGLLLQTEVGRYVDSLARAARAYADSLRPDVQAFAQFGPQATNARSLHARLSRANTVAVFQPLMIALRERRPDDGAGYVEVLDMCLRFAVRAYIIGGWRADAAQTRLYRIAYDLSADQGEAQIGVVIDELRQLVLDYAPDSLVHQNMLDQEMNWYAWRSLKFFLYEYELSLNKGAKPDVDFAFFEKAKREKTVEHILPQTPTDKYWRSRFTPTQRKNLVHNIGNLVLTLDNSAYGNKKFPDKRGAAGPGEERRACYAQAPLRQEQALASIMDWTPDQILGRQQALADWALERWAVETEDLGDDPLAGVDPDEADAAEKEQALTVSELPIDGA